MRFKDRDLIAFADFLFAGWLVNTIGFGLYGLWNRDGLHLLIAVMAFVFSTLSLIIREHLLLKKEVNDLQKRVWRQGR